jgi:Asp-tRNA(Asn)/Glu-tRNA(Gln) amidotransferase A subunit family amidase
MTITWEAKSAAKRAERDSKIPKEWLLSPPLDSSVKNVMSVARTCGLLTQHELDLTQLDATDLVGLLACGVVSSYELTLAFCKRAAIAQQLTNCLAEVFFDEGLARAKELDEHLSLTGKTVGPLHGLPFSIKDQFDIEGKDSAAGFVAWIGHPKAEDAAVVRILREAGVVLYCKTTNPQTLMHLETVSNIYGRTVNPHNRGLTSGGSSGGEGALVGFYGSPIGLGADGGGSIRCPAACVGAYGMRSTAQRVPITGLTLPNVGGDSTPVVAGPICRSARDNELFFKVVLATQPWLRDPSVVAMPWRSVETPNRLKVAYYADDGVVRPHPPVHRAMNMLIERLKADGRFEIVPWKPYEHAYGYDLIRKLFFMDGGAKNFDPMSEADEPVLPNSAWILKESHTKLRTIHQAWDLRNQRDLYRKAYAEYWMAHEEPDVLLCPWASGVAFRHDTSRYWGYTAIWNLLDYPSITFPSGLSVDPAVDVKDTAYVPRENEFDTYIQSTYDPEEFRDAPIALQLVARPWQDEELFAALRQIESSLGRDVQL